jgi:hypothetical protein
MNDLHPYADLDRRAVGRTIQRAPGRALYARAPNDVKRAMRPRERLVSAAGQRRRS